MKLAIFHPSFGTVGGAEILAAAEARALRANGVDARIVTASVNESRWSDTLQNIPVSQFERPSVARKLAWTVGARLRATARQAQPFLQDADAVIAHNYPCNVLLGSMQLNAVRLWQVNEPARPLYLPESSPVMTARAERLGSDAPDFLTRQFAERLESWKQRKSRGGRLVAKRNYDLASTQSLDGLYAISKYSQGIARQIYGRCSNTIVYPSVALPAQVPVERRGIRRNALNVLVQSRLEAIKNVETVMRGFSSFAEHCQSAQMHVVGEGSDKERLQMVATEFPRANITFHDFLSAESLAALAAACDVFALLPVDEPFGMVFTEAMSRGMLCIGPDHGGPSEILDNGRLGWRVSAFSSEQLAHALHAIVALTDDEANHRRAAAHASVATRFSDIAMVASIRAVLHEHGVH